MTKATSIKYLFVHRILPMIMTVIIAVNFLPQFSLYTRADESNNSDKITLYKWRQIDGMGSLPKDEGVDHRILLLYSGKKGNTSNTYYVSGTSLGNGNKEIYGLKIGDTKELADMMKYTTFYTEGPLNTPFITYTGSDDKDNKYDGQSAPKYYINIPDSQDQYKKGLKWVFRSDSGKYFQFKTQTDYNNWDLDADDEKHDKFEIWASGKNIEIFVNDPSAYDSVFAFSDSKVYSTDDDDQGDWEYEFRAYIGEPIEVSVLSSDLVVEKGQVYHLEGPLFVKKDVNIVIEEGGMLSVDGTIYNNGSISNSGILMLQKNSCMEAISIPCQTTSTSNELFCDGGDLIVMSEAKMIFKSKYGGLDMQSGSGIINFGYILSGISDIILQDVMIDNRQSGRIRIGMVINDNYNYSTNKISTIDSWVVAQKNASTNGEKYCSYVDMAVVKNTSQANILINERNGSGAFWDFSGDAITRN